MPLVTPADPPSVDLPSAQTFADELEKRVIAVQAALNQFLAAWGTPQTASDLNRLSGAGATVCWQVFRVATTNQPLREARNVPTSFALRKMLAVAEDAGISKSVLDAVVEAADSFKEFSKRTARDRAAFESLVAGVQTAGDSEKIQLSQRRSAYRSASHIRGNQVDFIYRCAMIRLSASGQGIDSVSFLVKAGMRRLRPDAHLDAYKIATNPSQTVGGRKTEHPLDADAYDQHGMPVLPRFSSQPLPEVLKIEFRSGIVAYRLINSAITGTDSVSVAIGARSVEAPFMIDVDGRRLYYSELSHVQNPCALSIHELLIHRPSLRHVRPDYSIHQFTEGDYSQEAVRHAQHYPVEEKLDRVGRANDLYLAELPCYSEMLNYGASQAGWDLSEFDAWRIRMPYPIMYSASRIFFYIDPDEQNA